jgi:proteic killer suppression protein
MLNRTVRQPACVETEMHRLRYTWGVQRNDQMILHFRDRATEHFWLGSVRRKTHRRYGDAALRKLDMLDRVQTLADLGAAPASRLKPLKGDRRGQHSIHVNDRWRICFVWTPRGPANVEIVDYH